MGIVLLGMFIPILALSIFSLVLSVRARRGKIKPDSAWVFLFIQILAFFLFFSNAVGGEAYLREVWVFFANVLITGILVCAVVMFTPRSKVLKKYM
jgi:membrane-bound acyltransferase YfiQ involved in biofilm formation